MRWELRFAVPIAVLRQSFYPMTCEENSTVTMGNSAGFRTQSYLKLNLKYNGRWFGYDTRDAMFLPYGKHVAAMWPPCEPPSPRQFSFKLSRAKRVTCQLAPRSGRGVCGGLARITTVVPNLEHKIS